ncbi:MAG: hypothetical protein WC936_06655 [Candidatus Nanoarchaeia archaeon]|jgi:hypothetical protein
MFGLACNSLIGLPLAGCELMPKFSAVNFLIIEPESYFIGFTVLFFMFLYFVGLNFFLMNNKIGLRSLILSRATRYYASYAMLVTPLLVYQS